MTPTWDVEQITRSTGARSALVTGGDNSVTVGRRGLYGYVLTNADLTLYDYVATAITTDATVDQKEVSALWVRAEANANLISILGTLLTETVGGYLAAAFKKLFDVAAPVLTVASVNQTGDAYAAANTRLPAALVGGRVDASVGAVANDAITAAALSDDAIDAILDETIESTYTLRQIVRILAAANAGKLSGAGTTNPKFKGLDGTTTRIDATTDDDGNRTAVVLDGTE